MNKLQTELKGGRFVMSTETVDRYGDVVSSASWDIRNFRNNPIALWNHDPDHPIGKWVNVEVKNGQLTGDLQLADEGTSPLIDTLRKLVEQDIVRAVSVGFRALDKEPTGNKSGWKFKSCELLECSLVSIPANAEALAVSRSFGLEDDVIFKSNHRLALARRRFKFNQTFKNK